MTTEEVHTLSVDASQAGMRLDKWLVDRLPHLSRSRLQGLIADGMLEDEDGPVTETSHKVRLGDTYELTIPAALPAEPEPENIPLDVAYEDEFLIVVNKPAGMVVHPAAGNYSGTLVNALLYHCRSSLSGIGGVQRPGIVHRLDKDTSGLIVAAKTDEAHRGLSAQFAEHSLNRAYHAICWGVPLPRQGEIEGSIGRSSSDRKKMAMVSHGGKFALTRYHVRRSFGTIASLVECRLATGRTHQIRVHMASIGHSLVGDPLYGHPTRGINEDIRRTLAIFPRQALHAFQLGFIHPATGQKINFEADFPKDIKDLISCLEGL